MRENEEKKNMCRQKHRLLVSATQKGMGSLIPGLGDHLDKIGRPCLNEKEGEEQVACFWKGTQGTNVTSSQEAVSKQTGMQ